MFAYRAAISRPVATSQHLSDPRNFAACFIFSVVAAGFENSAIRAIPSSVSGNPVDMSGSTKPAADGRSAQFRPAILELRNDRRGM